MRYKICPVFTYFKHYILVQNKTKMLLKGIAKYWNYEQCQREMLKWKS